MSFDPFISSSSFSFSSLSRRPWNNPPRASRPVRSAVSSSLYRGPKSERWERCDLTAASSLSADLLGLRVQEREQLVGLNDRFATYIEKVRHLEQQNRVLLAQLEALRSRQRDPSRLQQLYEVEARGLRAQLDQEAHEKAGLQAERERLREALKELKQCCQQEVQRRGEQEEVLMRTREEAGHIAVGYSDAEASMSSLQQELGFLKRVFQEEQAGLRAQVQMAGLTVEMDVSRPDLSSALREIRAQYERLAGRNMAAAEDWLRGKVATMAEQAGRNEEAVRSIREETQEYRRLLQSRSSEIEALRNVIDSLNRQLDELEEMQGREVSKYQGRISDLERDIGEAKEEMSRYLREYQDLLNVKMALDIEIAAYRKLLEGEEFRLTFSSFPALT